MASIDLLEEANFARLARLLVGKGTEALRNQFDAINPPATLSVVLAANQKSLLRLKFRVINKSQWDLLYPPSGKPPDSKTFDVSLLTVLFRNICRLPSTRWDSVPLDTDRSLQANIIRIKTLRNEVFAHATSTRLDAATFESLWKKIAQSLVELNIPQKDIDELKECPLSPEKDNSLEVLRSWKSIDDSLLEMVVNLNTDLKDMKSDVKDIKKLCQLGMQQQSDEVPSQCLAMRSSQLPEDTNIEVNRHRDEDLLQSLAKHNFDGKIKKKVKNFLPGTREWLLKDVDDWFTKNDQESSILLLTAGPGFGKSVFAAKVCEIFKEKGKLAACHFCDFRDANLSDAMMMLQSLASQMCKNVDGFKEKLLDQLKRPHKIHTLKEAFRIYLQNPLDELEVEEPSLVVIDGLDESAADNRSEIVNLIAEYFSELPDSIKFLVTSRPELSVAKLSDLPKINITNSHAKNNVDIQIYLKSCLPILLESDKDSYRKLAEMCEGSFLYAYYVQSELKKRSDLANVTLDEIIKFLPKGLASVYHAYFRRLEDELKAVKRGNLDVLKILQMLVAQRGPLPLTFVAHALALAPECRETKTIINKINESLSCLLYVDDDSVTIFHKSVVDWLLAQGYEVHEYTVTVDDGNKLLWLTCEQTIKRFKEKIPTYVNDLSKDYTYGDAYALTYGVDHLVACDMKESFFWLVDVVLVYHILRISPVNRVWSLFYLWNDILRVEPILSNKLLQARVSWHIIELEYLQSHMRWTENSLSLSYLKSILTHSPKGCFSDEEKGIAQSILLTFTRFLEYAYDKYDVQVMPLAVWFAKERIGVIALSRNKTLAAVALKKEIISVVSLPSLVELWQCTIKDVYNIPCCTFAPDDSFILYGKLETALNISSKKEVPFFTKITESFKSCAFSQNGKRLITSNGSRTIKLWDVPKQRLITKLLAEVRVNWCSFDITGLFIMAYKRYAGETYCDSPDGELIDDEDEYYEDEYYGDEYYGDELFMCDSDSDASLILEFKAETSSVGKTDQREKSSFGNSGEYEKSSVEKLDDEEEFSVEGSDVGNAFTVWNAFTLKRCDERILPKTKTGNELHSKICKRCFRPGLFPPAYKVWKYPNRSWRSLRLPCDRDLSNGIYNGVECWFSLDDKSFYAIENAHGARLAVCNFFCIRSYRHVNDDDEEFSLKSREIEKLDNNRWLYSDEDKLVVLRMSEAMLPTTVYSTSFCPDGSRLATCTSDGYINIWNVDARQVEQRFKKNRGGIRFLCWWSKKFLFVFDFFDRIPGLTKHPMGTNLQIQFSESKEVSLGHLLNEFVSVTQVVDFSVGFLFLCCGKTKPVRILDVNEAGGPQFITLPGLEPMMNITVSPDGGSFVFGGGKDVFYIWEKKSASAVAYDVYSTGRLTKQESFTKPFASCFSNNSKIAVVVYPPYKLGSNNGVILDLCTGHRKDVAFQGIISWFSSPLFCINKSRVVVTANNTSLKFMDMDSGAHFWSSFQRYFTSDLSHMKLSPNETIVAFCKINGDMDFLRLSIPQNSTLENIKRMPAIEWQQKVERFRTTHGQMVGTTFYTDNSTSYFMI